MKDELEPMFAANARLSAKIAAGRVGKGKTSNIRRKTFQGGGVGTFVGGGSSTAVSFRTVKVVLLDELDKLKPLAEGDADSLASKRVSTFGTDYKILRFSKPTEEGSSRIARHYARGTMSRYLIACPGCSEVQELGWSLLRFDDTKMRCEHCKQFFDQDTWLEQPGEWKETVQNRHHKSFQSSALISPLIRWEVLIDEYRQAIAALEAGDNTLIRVFENSRLGQVFGGRVEKVEAQSLYDRREYWGEPATPVSVIPEGTVAVTLGIDVQSDGFFWLLAAFGRKMETWLPVTGRIIGDMRAPEPWAELEKVLAATWLDNAGNGYRPVISAIDCQGDYYAEVLAFVKANSFRHRLRAIRGWAPARGRGGHGVGLLRNAYTDKSTLTKVTNIDTDAAKTMLATMLAREHAGPAYVHIPCGRNGEPVGGWDLEVIGELTAEYRRQMPSKGGYTHYQWFKRPGRPNHRLDCAAYALAALAMSRLKIDDCSLQRTEARNVGQPAPAREREERPGQGSWGAQPLTTLGTRASESVWYGDSGGGGLSGYNVKLPPGDPAARGGGFGALPGSGIVGYDP